MNVLDYASLVIWILALILGVMAYLRHDGRFRQGLQIAWKQAFSTVPKIVLAVLVSGFFAQIVPTELVAEWLGKDAGLRGIVIGSLVGGLTPGGPVICFPIVYVFLKTGAAVPALISFVTAWSVFAVHRVLAYEIPLMGVRFVKIRIISCLILPPLAGLMAEIITNGFGIEI
ncbi:MAG: permease [Deltaproteobacteria bacterium]|nr:permease [Deltaproteobacteria bacterium]